jgi:excisionase family DNA binding protein
MEELIDVKGLSRILNIHEATLRAWTAKGKIPSLKVGRLRRFKVSEVEAWLKAQESQTQIEVYV